MEQLYSKNEEYPKVLPDVVRVKSNNVALHGEYMSVNKEDVTPKQLTEVGYIQVEPEPERTQYISNVFWNGREWEMESYTEDQWRAMEIDKGN